MGKVLIIDDDRLNSEMLQDMIITMGHKVASAFTAEEGLTAALSHGFDVVFLDVQLPDGNGLMLVITSGRAGGYDYDGRRHEKILRDIGTTTSKTVSTYQKAQN